MSGFKFEIYEGKKGFWSKAAYRWRLVAGNGEVVAHGEGYSSKYNAQRAVQTVADGILSAEVVDLTRT